MSVPQIFLYDHPVSSYAQKVRMILRTKGIAFTAKTPRTLSGDADPDFVKHSPRLEVPCLVHAEAAVFDSTVISEYLEEAFPHAPAVYPPASEPLLRAKVRMVEDVVDTAFEAINWGWGEVYWQGRAGGEGEPLYEHLRAETRRQTGEMYDWLETQLEADKPFFGGGAAGAYTGFSVADAIAVAVVNRSVYYGFPPPKESKLDAWFERCKQLPAVKDTLQEFHDNVGKMFESAKLFTAGGKFKRQYRDFRLEWMVKSGGMEIVQDGLRKNNIKFNWPQGQASASGEQ